MAAAAAGGEEGEEHCEEEEECEQVPEVVIRGPGGQVYYPTPMQQQASGQQEIDTGGLPLADSPFALYQQQQLSQVHPFTTVHPFPP